MTAGNAMKWDATEPTEGVFTYTDADAIVAFARANGMKVRGHTFVWHNQTPAWTFTNGQVINQSWSSTYAQSGANVTVTNAAWNGVIGANGGSASFGFLSSWSGANTGPTAFTLNGGTCVLG